MSLPSAQPAYIFRGHAAQIHWTSFIRSNTRLLSGDADGWIVIWNLAIKRPVAVWRAHEGAILGASSWGADKIITHGKDNKLIVCKLSEEDEATMSTVLPVDMPPEPRKQPWLLHVLYVNTMNFCSFAQCNTQMASAENITSNEELLIAVPNTMSSETVDIFHLPSCERIHTAIGNTSLKGGMVMAISIFYHRLTTHLTVIAGYESGHTVVSELSTEQTWQMLYATQAHTQPILSLDVSISNEYFLTSSADATIAKHPIPVSIENVIMAVPSVPLKTIQTKHAGQQGLRIRNDGRIFATAGWDSKVRVYSAKGMKELAVLKWHKDGCYSVAFADVGATAESEGFEAKDDDNALMKRLGTMTVQEQRIWKAKAGHWLAAGSKDGKISLWDIY